MIVRCVACGGPATHREQDGTPVCEPCERDEGDPTAVLTPILNDVLRARPAPHYDNEGNETRDR